MLYVHIFHATLGLDVSPYEVPPHIPEHRPCTQDANRASPYPHAHTPSLPLCSHILPPPPHPFKLNQIQKIVIKIIKKLI